MLNNLTQKEDPQRWERWEIWRKWTKTWEIPLFVAWDSWFKMMMIITIMILIVIREENSITILSRSSSTLLIMLANSFSESAIMEKKKTVFEQNCSKFKTNASYYWDQIVYHRIHFFKKGLLNLSGNWCQSKRNCNNYCPDWNVWLTEISDWLTLLKIQLTNNHLIVSLYFTNAFQPKAIQHICKATLCFG